MRTKISFKIILFSAFIFYSCNTVKDDKNEVSQLKTEDAKATKRKKVRVSEIEEGIKANIDEEVRTHGGYFHLKSDTAELKLKLVRVHTEYLSNLGPNYHFACVDLADISGDVYDVDFF